MDNKTFQYGTKLFDSYDMGLADSSSDTINLKDNIGYSIHANWQGMVGTGGKVETKASNDGTNWVLIDTKTISGSEGDHLLNVERAMYSFIRVDYTKGSVTDGALTVTPAVKAR